MNCFNEALAVRLKNIETHLMELDKDIAGNSTASQKRRAWCFLRRVDEGRGKGFEWKEVVGVIELHKTMNKSKDATQSKRGKSLSKLKRFV